MNTIFDEAVKYYSPLLDGKDVVCIEETIFNHNIHFSGEPEITENYLESLKKLIVEPKDTTTFEKIVNFED